MKQEIKLQMKSAKVKDSSKKIISEEVSNFDPIETIQNFFEGGTNSKGTPTSNPPTPTSDSNFFEHSIGL